MDPWKSSSLPPRLETPHAFLDDLFPTDAETKAEYMETNAQIQETLSSLNKLNLPPVKGPPPPPPLLSLQHGPQAALHQKKTLKKKTRLGKKELISTTRLDSGPVSPKTYSKSLVDPTALKRVLKQKESVPIYKQVLIDGPESDEDGQDAPNVRSGWREPQLVHQQQASAKKAFQRPLTAAQSQKGSSSTPLRYT